MEVLITDRDLEVERNIDTKQFSLISYEFPEATLSEKHDLSETWVTQHTFIKVYCHPQLREKMWKDEVGWYVRLKRVETIRTHEPFVISMRQAFVTPRPICNNQYTIDGLNYVMVMDRADSDLFHHANSLADSGGLSCSSFNHIANQLIEIVDTLIHCKFYASDLCLENFLIVGEKIYLADLTDVFEVRKWVDSAGGAILGRYHVGSYHPLQGVKPVDYRNMMYFSLGCCILQLLTGITLSYYRLQQVLVPGYFQAYFNKSFPKLGINLQRRELLDWLPRIDDFFSHVFLNPVGDKKGVRARNPPPKKMLTLQSLLQMVYIGSLLFFVVLFLVCLDAMQRDIQSLQEALFHSHEIEADV